MSDLPDEEVPMAEEPAEEEILEEEVPLASVPKTGDMSVLWLALTALSGSGLAGLSVLEKKRKENDAE